MRLSLLSLLLVALLVGCADMNSTSRSDTGPAPETTLDLADYLRFRGYMPEARGLSSDPMVSTAAQEYLVPGSGYLQVYEFSSATEAASATDNVVLSELATPPSAVYQHGPLVVAYFGTDSGMNRALTRAFGEARF